VGGAKLVARVVSFPVRGPCAGSAERLWDDTLDHAQLLEIGGGDLHCLGGVGRLLSGAPQDRGAAFGRDHRIDAVLEH
jgi:hypothetical protein